MHVRNVVLMLAVLFPTSCSKQPVPARQPGASAGSAPPESAAFGPGLPDSPTADATLARLRGFLEFSRRDDITDEKLAVAADELNKNIEDRHLAVVEQFALSDEAGPVAWVFVQVLVDRGQFDAAARVAVHDLVRTPEDREYRMWKWWYYNFEDRPDYMDLSREFGESLLRQFAAGTAEEKLVISEVFGKGPAEAAMTAEEFRAAIQHVLSPPAPESSAAPSLPPGGV